MNKAFSLYLDVIRFFAALAVFLAHLASTPFTDHVIWWRLEGYGDSAVTIFFLLSGYVIAHVAATREQTHIEYFTARMARLYSVVGIALVLTFVFDSIGASINPDFYSIQKVMWKPASWEGYLSSLVFVNEYQVFGFDGISPGTNGPFWSLSFEFTYYIIAGLVLFAPRIIWIPLSIIILGLAGKTIVALLPVWALGFQLYHFPVSRRIPVVIKLIVACVSAASILTLPVLLATFSNDNFGFSFPWGRAPYNRNLLQDYSVALLFALHLLSVRSLLSKFVITQTKIASVVRWLGVQTFPLYCFHYPAICLFAAISPWENSTLFNAVFISICTLAVVAALTPVCENLKKRIRVTSVEYWNRILPADLIPPKP